MPKKTAQRIIDRPKSAAGMGGAVLVGGSVGTVTAPHSHSFSALTGTATTAQVPWAAAETLTLTAGAGLTGGGTLEADRTFAVGAGLGITVNADDVALASSTAGAGLTYTSGVLAVGAGNGLTVNADDVALTTPGTLTVSTSNSASGSHTHAVTSSSDVSAGGTALLSSNAGALTVATLTAGTQVNTPKVATVSGALTMDAAGDEITIAPNNNVRRSGYASQTTGWAIDYNGAADFRYLYSDEMHVKIFIADLEQALAGGQIIAKSVAVVHTLWTVPAAGDTVYLYVRDLPSAAGMAVFQSGDFVRLRRYVRSGGSLSIADVWGAVSAFSADTGPSGAEVGVQRWNFQRSTGSNAGSAAAGTTIPSDSLALDYGTSGNGFHEVNAIDGAYAVNSPYSQIVTWTTHPATGQAVRVRTGNLYGITGATEFGLWAGDTTNANLLITSAGVKLRQGTTDKIVLDSSGASYFAGVMTIGTSGGIYQGSGTFASPTTGLKIWNDSGTGRIGGYRSGAEQWSAATDGEIVAGAGHVRLYSGGLAIERAHTESSYNDYRISWWDDPSPTGRAGTVRAELYMWDEDAAPLRNAALTLKTTSDYGITLNANNFSTLRMEGGTSYIAGAYIDPAAYVGDGTAAAPSYSFESDQDTGMYSVAGNELDFATNGTRRLKIDTSTFLFSLPLLTTDADHRNLFGKAVIGAVTTSAAANHAYFANSAIDSHAGAALIQNSTGDTYVQAADGRDGYIRVNGSANLMAKWNATAFSAEKPLGIKSVTAPGSSYTGYALVYVDSADGDLKVRFDNGTVKTLATN